MEKLEIDWEKINSELPTQKTKEALELRKKLFNGFDPNGNGYLSLAEVDKGIRDVLKLPELFGMKRVIMRAFQAAKNYMPSKSKVGDDYIGRGEFRFFLVCLRQYLEYWVMFERIDSSDDKKISIDEFTAALPKLKEWGIEVEDVNKTFGQIDTNKGGSILFDEFCHWAIKHNLDLEDDVDFENDLINKMK